MALFQCFPPHTESEEEISHGNKNVQKSAYILLLTRFITRSFLVVMDWRDNFPLHETKRELDAGENERCLPPLEEREEKQIDCPDGRDPVTGIIEIWELHCT